MPSGGILLSGLGKNARSNYGAVVKRNGTEKFLLIWYVIKIIMIDDRKDFYIMRVASDWSFFTFVFSKYGN